MKLNFKKWNLVPKISNKNGTKKGKSKSGTKRP